MNKDLKNNVGVGLRHTHFPYLSENTPSKIGWFEIITENFFQTRGRPFQILEKVRNDFPISMHGVSLSIGAKEELNLDYLKKVKELIDIIDPIMISDHLCWTGQAHRNLHNLLPLPYNEEGLNHVVSRIQKVQDYYQRPIAIENLSAYFTLKNSTYTEWEFLKEVAQRSGSSILLDINNIYVNSVNQEFDPKVYLDHIPMHLVSEIHLAGFSDMGTHLFDTHSMPVYPEVWELYRYKIAEKTSTPTLIEWDEDIPEFPILEAEAIKASTIIQNILNE
jgi:uncharacterized protein